MANRTPSHEEPPSVAEARAALLHLAELTAAYEGRGAHVGNPAAVGEDLRTLKAVTEALLQHRRGQRHPGRNAVVAALIESFTADYRRFRDDERLTPGDLARSIGQACRELGLEPTEDELNQIVLRRDVPPGEYSADDTMKSLGGPVEAAKAALSGMTGWSVRQLAKFKTDAGKTALIRHAFGRWVTRGVREKYLRELLDTVETADAGAGVALGSLRNIGEPAVAALDVAAERSMLELFTTERGLRTLFEGGLPGRHSAEWKRGFDAAADTYHRGVVQFVELVRKHPESAVAVISEVQNLPNERVAAVAYFAIAARVLGLDDQTLSDVDAALKDAVRAHLIYIAREHFAERLGEARPPD